MKFKKPAPASIGYRGKRYDWLTNYAFKSDARKRVKSLERLGAKAVIADLTGAGFNKYAVYVRHDLKGLLAR